MLVSREGQFAVFLCVSYKVLILFKETLWCFDV
jgi:hypothetical protein